MRHYKWKETGVGVVDNLGRQFQRIMRGATQGSIETRRRYIEACERFLKFVGPHFKLQKISNLADKHLEEYVRYLKQQGKSDKYVKTELSAIRYLHRQIPNVKSELCESQVFNRKVGLGSTPDGRSDRAWTTEEMRKMIEVANRKGRPEVTKVVEGACLTGLRLDEIATIRRHEVEAALRTGYLMPKNTKGGRPRQIPLTEQAMKFFEEAIRGVPRGGYVFCPPGMQIHKFKQSVQKFIYDHRKAVQDENRKPTAHNLTPEDRAALSFHGTRHTFAREIFSQLIQQGESFTQARKKLAELLGHGRPGVTKIYTGIVRPEK